MADSEVAEQNITLEVEETQNTETETNPEEESKESVDTEEEAKAKAEAEAKAKAEEEAKAKAEEEAKAKEEAEMAEQLAELARLNKQTNELWKRGQQSNWETMSHTQQGIEKMELKQRASFHQGFMRSMITKSEFTIKPSQQRNVVIRQQPLSGNHRVNMFNNGMMFNRYR